MDHSKIASAVIQHVGGKDNIKSVTHCATRLRFQLRNNDLRNEEAISDLEGVKGVFLTQSQFQIIFGAGLVNLICDEVQKQLGTLSTTASDEEPEKHGNVLQRLVKMLSDIFVPIIPAIVAGGLLMGLNNILTADLFHGQSLIELYPQWSGLTTAINTFANAPFTFLPVLIAFSATKRFGGNPFLGAAMGMIMVHPDLLNAYSIGIAEAPVWDILGFQIPAIGYQGTVLPVLAVTFILANLEKRLHKVTPSWLDNLTTPLLSIIVTSFLTFIFVGPIMREAGNLLAEGITWLYNTLGFIGGGIFGLVYAPITLTGMHHSFIAIETQLIADKAVTGGSFIFSTASMNNVAQGAAVLAVLLMTKNEKVKSICSASGISALLGITEPAMFGVTLKFKYPFYAAITGSAVGSAYLAGTRTLAQALGAAGLPGFISMEPNHYLDFAIGLILSMAVSFFLTIVFWKKYNLGAEDGSQKSTSNEPKAEQTKQIETVKKEQKNTASNADESQQQDTISNADEKQQQDTVSNADKKQQNTASELEKTGNHGVTTITAPLKGEVLSVEQSNDPMFASKAMGCGILINPTEGVLVAPCDGTISLVFPTKHAIGITSSTGVELLIHVGINTVQMEGQGFDALVEVGDSITRGQKLLTFDQSLIHEQGYDSQTMVILPETEESRVTITENPNADFATTVMEIQG